MLSTDTSVPGTESIELMGYPDVDMDSWYRHNDEYSKTKINITKLLKSSQMSYSQMKYKFYNSFKNVSIQAIPIGVEIYDATFHKRLLEDCIRYAFNVLTNRNFPVSELHEFYFKMLYFYDRLEMILFASHVLNKKNSDYSSYTTKPNPRINPYKIEYPDTDKGTGKEKGKGTGKEKGKGEKMYNAFLITSIAKSSLPAKLEFDRLNEFISKEKDVSAAKKSHGDIASVDIRVDKSGSKVKITPVPSNMLPVGHFLNLDSTEVVVPYLYIPGEDDWRRAPEFVKAMEANTAFEVENDILIGYYDKVMSGIDVKFKTRSPVQKIVKHTDTRLIETGAACDNKRKEEIVGLLELVGIIRIGEESNIRELCETLKLELMKRELLSRQNARHGKGLIGGKRVRWFYMHFEKQPTI
jgi:hypothetical protein